MLDLAGQRPFSVRFGWAAQDLAALAHPSNVIVIVDILRFTTAVSVAVGRGAAVLPFRHRDVAAQRFTVQQDAVLAGRRGRVRRTRRTGRIRFRPGTRGPGLG